MAIRKPRSDAREKAKGLLTYYMEYDPDTSGEMKEVESIVDLIVKAAVAECSGESVCPYCGNAWKSKLEVDRDSTSTVTWICGHCGAIEEHKNYPPDDLE